MSTEFAVEEPPVVETPPEGLTPEELERRLKLQIVDVSQGIGAHAIDAADEHIRRNSHEGGIKGFVKRIWHGNLARDYIRAKRVQEGRRDIIESGNLYALSGGSQAEHNEAMQSIVQRFTSEYDLVRKDNGESNESFDDAENGKALESQVKELVKEFARGNIGMEALVEEKTRILNEYGRHVHPNDRNKGKLYADNIVEVAQNARLAFQHEVDLERIDAALKGSIGEAKIGVRTEAKYEKVDKIVDRLYQSKAGALVNEATLVGLVSLGMNLAKVSTRKATTALGATIGLGVGAGVIAGARESVHIKQERQLHMRQMAEGGQMAENSKRRESLERTRYNASSAQELISDLQSGMDGVNLVGETDPFRLSILLSTIAAVQSRIEMSDTQNIDLITFSSKTSVENERLALDIKLAEAKVALQRIIDTTPSEQLTGAGIGTKNIDELIATRLENVNDFLERDIDKKNREFRILRLKRTIGMGAAGAAAGITLGLGFQEAKALAEALAFSGLDGIFTSPNDPNRHTLLAGLFGHNNGGSGGGSDVLHLDRVDPTNLHHGAMQLPEGYHLGNNGHSVIGPDGNHVVDGLQWSDNGKLSDASMQALTEKGFGLQDNLMHYTHHHHEIRKHHYSPHEFFKHGHKGFVRDHRQLWYDNNTPAPVFDQNELRMDWGANGAGIDSHGNYVFNVSRMTPDGSFHGGLSANAQELAREHKLVVALSMTKDSQHFVKLIHIDQHGNAVIDKDSIAGKTMFTHEGGHAKFIGAYAETAQVLSQSKEHGVSTRMLATVVGENHPHNVTEVTKHLVSEPREYHILTVTPPESIPTEIPPVLPIYARRGLENLGQTETTPRSPENPNNPEDPYSYYVYDRERAKAWEEERSPRLRENPSAELNTGEELSWYRNEIERRRGAEYLAELDSNIENDEVLKSIDNETKALVCMPVAAASESENIYNTLSLYAQQSKEAQDATVILMNVNWMSSYEGDPEKMAKILKTLSEIERAKKDFPNLRIASFERQWSEEFIKRRKNKIYGEVIKVLYDTAAIAVERAINDNRRDGSDEALIITNDADAQGLRSDYLDKYIKALGEKGDVDIFTGLIRWGTKEYKDFPGYGVANGFYGVLNMITQNKANKKKAGVHTIGPNSGFRLSAYAAVGGCEDRDDMGAGADSVLGHRVIASRTENSSNPVLRNGYTASGGYGPRRNPEDRIVADREVIGFVHGAQIDTMADRLLAAYKKNLFLGAGWQGFDNGGYEERGASAASAPAGREVVARDMDTIAKRLETNVEGFATYWFRDPAVVSSAIALYFGTKDNQGRKLYDSSWNNGRFSFKFTSEGKEFLKQRLLRDRRGRFDTYGPRIRRQLYNEVEPGAKRQPAFANPRFVSSA